MSRIADQWIAAATYERFMGRWSRTLARDFVQWLQPASQLHWLDLGCGTGALTNAICAGADPASVTACDPARPFLEYARRSMANGRASFVLAAAEDFPLREGGYDVIGSLLALNFFPNPAAALARMHSAAAPGGSICACVWDYSGDMQFLRYFWDAAIDLDLAPRHLDEGVRFPICRPDALLNLFRGAGLDGVRCEALDITTEFTNMDDYWAPLLGGSGPAPSFVASLKAPEQSLLRDRLEQVIPRQPDGTIRLHARAWAVQGQRT